MATSVKFSNPKSTDSGNGVTAFSDSLLLTLGDGSVVVGYLMKYLCDVNAVHIQAKKGDIVYSTVDHVKLDNVTGWDYLSKQESPITE